MAKESDIVKARRKPKFSTRLELRCENCGRSRGVLKKFKLCRICLRENFMKGTIPGIKKSSW